MTDAQLRMDDDAKPAALHTTEELQRLVSEHHELDLKIQNLSIQSYLTDQQKLEEVQLKKRKLALKDRIAGLMRSGPPRAIAPESRT